MIKGWFLSGDAGIPMGRRRLRRRSIWRKFDALMEIVKKKQTETKNKLMIFSSFRHTLHYLYNKLTEQGLRVGLIHGDVIDEERRELRKRFNPNQTPCEDKTALDIVVFSMS